MRIGFDIETSSLSCEHGEIVGFSYTFNGIDAYYIPIAHKVGRNAIFKTPLQNFFHILRKAIVVYVYNSRFEMRWLAKDGLDIDQIKFFDAKILVYNMDTNVKKNNLKWAALHYLGYKCATFAETVGDREDFSFVDPVVATPYACDDSLMAFLLAKKLGPILMEECPFPIKMDNAFIPTLLKMEDTVIPLDEAVLTDLYDEVSTRVDDVFEETQNIAGQSFNPGSSAQVSNLLTQFGIDTGVKTKTGFMSTKQDLLEKMEHPLCKKIAEHRRLIKMRSSYVDVLRKAAQSKIVRFNYNDTRVPCLTEKAMVNIKGKGFISIRGVKIGDLIWTRFGWNKVTGTKKTLNADVYRMILRDGTELEGTGHHPVMNEYGQWVGIRDYKVNDRVKLNTREMVDIYRKEIVYIKNNSLKPFVYDRVTLPKYMTTELAELMGFIAGDGSIVREAVKLCYDIKDRHLQKYYNNSFSEIFGKKIPGVDTSGGCASYKFCSVAIRDYLIKLETKEDRIPSIIKASGSHFLKAWLRGFFDADGSVVLPSVSVRVCNVKYNLIKEVKLVLSFLGINSRLYWKGKSDKRPRLELALRTSSDNFRYNNIIGFNSLTKQERLLGLVDSSIEYGSGEVEVVNFVGKDTVYDISVDDSHEFIANGIVVHNTGRFAAGGDKKNPYFTSLNIQSLPSPSSADWFAKKTDSENSILGWEFSQDKDFSDIEVEGHEPDMNIRRAFRGPKDYLFFHMDYSGQELRLAANLSKEKNWIDDFLNGRDVHKSTAISVWGEESYNKDKRKAAKIVNFRNLYGGTAYSLAKQLEWPLHEAEFFMDKWMKYVPTLCAWMERVKMDARRDGTVYTPFRRPRRVLEYFSTGSWKDVKFGERTAVNTIIQGGAADLMRLFLNKVGKIFETYKDKIIFVSMIHDEYNCYVHKSIIEEVCHAMMDAATYTRPDWPVPMICDFDIGYSWGEYFPFEFGEDGRVKLKVA